MPVFRGLGVVSIFTNEERRMLTPENCGCSELACNIINSTFLSLDGFAPMRERMDAMNLHPYASKEFAADLARVADRELKTAPAPQKLESKLRFRGNCEIEYVVYITQKAPGIYTFGHELVDRRGSSDGWYSFEEGYLKNVHGQPVFCESLVEAEQYIRESVAYHNESLREVETVYDVVLKCVPPTLLGSFDHECFDADTSTPKGKSAADAIRKTAYLLGAIAAAGEIEWITVDYGGAWAAMADKCRQILQGE